MAETVTIQGQSYLRRNPLGVLGLSFILLMLAWYNGLISPHGLGN